MSERELDERFEELFERSATGGADDGPAEAIWAATFADDEVVEGLTLAELGRAIHSGRLTRDDLIWRPGLRGWKKAGELPVLEHFFLPPPLTAPLRAAAPHLGLQGLVANEMSRLDEPAAAEVPEFMPALPPADADAEAEGEAVQISMPLPAVLEPAPVRARKPAALMVTVIALAVLALALLGAVVMLVLAAQPAPPQGPVIELVDGVPYVRVDNKLVRLAGPTPPPAVVPAPAPTPAPAPAPTVVVAPLPPRQPVVLAPAPRPVVKQPPAVPVPPSAKPCDPLSEDCATAAADDSAPGLPMGEVLTTVKAHVAEVHGCGAKHGAAMIRVGWSIAPDGGVNNVRVLDKNAGTPLGNCISAKVGAWRFPTAPGKTVVPSFPFKVNGP